MGKNIEWIKTPIGLFDYTEFKRIKRAKFDDISYRDKLTAVWFELLDLVGKCNNEGYIIDDIGDIAVMLDREESEIEFCIDYFLNTRMLTRTNDGLYVNNMGYNEHNEYVLDCGDKRTSQQYKDWRMFVLKRDNYTCMICGKTNVILHVHHIKEWAKNPESRFEHNNGITLCADCHRKIHRKSEGI